MKKTFFALLITAFIMAVAGSLFAQGRGRGMDMSPGMGRYDLSSMPGLNLSSDQIKKINDLRTAHLKDIQPLRNQMFAKRGELRLLWQERNPDKAKIDSVQRDIQNLRSQMISKQTTFRLALLNVLTPEQRERIQAANWGGPRGKGGTGGHMGHGQEMGPDGQEMGPGMGGRAPQ